MTQNAFGETAVQPRESAAPLQDLFGLVGTVDEAERAWITHRDACVARMGKPAMEARLRAELDESPAAALLGPRPLVSSG